MVIQWTPQAVKNLKDIYQFYLPETGRTKALAIVAELRAVVKYLLIFPEMGAIEYIEGKPTAYRYLVKNHCKIYYTVQATYVRIAFVWDTRRNPRLLRHYFEIRK